MNRRTDFGLWLASLGAALQLVGLSWDALQHQLDPGLAAREDVFALTNPSHLLFAGGLLMTVAGLAWFLVLTGWRSPVSGGRRPGRLLAAATLAMLCLGMAGTALAAGGPIGRHEHAHPGPEGQQHGVGAEASGGMNVTSSPTFAILRQVVQEQGTEAALTRLEELAAADGAVLVVAHDYAHAIGKFSFVHYGGAPQAFGHCRETFQSGCYHGVLEAHLESNPQLTPGEIANLCDSSITPNATRALRFQCLHGLGHGLTANFQHDIFRALRVCDVLESGWDRESCYGGVFMENVIFATQQLAGDDHQHDHGGGHRVHLEAGDPLYPCNVVDERYKRECFTMQTSAMLLYNGRDFTRAMGECDRAPRQYVHVCYQSIGRDVSSETYRDPGRSLEICLRGQSAFAGWCLVGVAKNLIDVTWQIDQALQLCASAPGLHKPLCYRAIGEQLGNLYAEREQIERECARSESDHVADCLRGAGIRG